MGSNVPPITPTRRAVTRKGYRCWLLEPGNRRRAVAPPHHPHRLAHLSAGQSARGVRRHPRAQTEPLVQLVHDLVLRHAVRLVRLAAHDQLWYGPTLVDDEEIVRRQLRAREHHRFHLARIDVDTTDDQHVVATAEHLAHPHQRPTAVAAT